MPLVLKLIGQFQGRKTYEIRDSFEGLVNIKLLNDLFIFWGLSSEDIEKIKLITDSEQIKNLEKSFPVKAYEDRIIFVFTSDIELRNKLVDIFMKEGQETSQIRESNQSTTITQPDDSNELVQPDSEICKPVTVTVSEDDSPPKLTSDLIDMMNIKSVSLFVDKDFKSLISIYLRRPELFGTLAHYVQNGNVHEQSLCHVKTIDELTDEELTHYKSLADKINHLEIGVTHEVIINKLIKFSGHINLALRSILCDMAKENHLNQ